jgi:hypothetical protein
MTWRELSARIGHLLAGMVLVGLQCGDDLVEIAEDLLVHLG